MAGSVLYADCNQCLTQLAPSTQSSSSHRLAGGQNITRKALISRMSTEFFKSGGRTNGRFDGNVPVVDGGSYYTEREGESGEGGCNELILELVFNERILY